MGKAMPVVHGLRRIIGIGERRLEYLIGLIKERSGDPSAASSLQYDKAETEYHRAALAVLAYHEAVLSPETSPVEALRSLLVELESLGFPKKATIYDPLASMMTRARRILGELR